MSTNKKYLLPNKVEFYITNVCNLTCDHCNRFNNFNFTGWQDWNDYKEDYRRLAEYIDLKFIVLMGGEPLLNPTVVDWVRGLNQTFDAGIQILTNGTRLNKVDGLYDAVAARHANGVVRNHIGVSLHNEEHFTELRDNIRSFLRGSIKEWGTIINKECPVRESNYGALYAARDSNGVLINMFQYTNFVTSAVYKIDGKYRLHNSNVEQAHDNCGFVKYKSYHFIRGKMYKCGPVALFPEFDRQHHFDISEQDREILNAYKPLTADNIAEYGDEFFKNLDNPIPQCKFCPSFSNGYVIKATPKGPKLI